MFDPLREAIKTGIPRLVRGKLEKLYPHLDLIVGNCNGEKVCVEAIFKNIKLLVNLYSGQFNTYEFVALYRFEKLAREGLLPISSYKNFEKVYIEGKEDKNSIVCNASGVDRAYTSEKSVLVYDPWIEIEIDGSKESLYFANCVLNYLMYENINESSDTIVFRNIDYKDLRTILITSTGGNEILAVRKDKTLYATNVFFKFVLCLQEEDLMLSSHLVEAFGELIEEQYYEGEEKDLSAEEVFVFEENDDSKHLCIRLSEKIGLDVKFRHDEEQQIACFVAHLREKFNRILG